MTSSEIIQEVVEVDRWTDDNFKNSNYYREYLDQVNKDLKDLLNKS